MNASITSFKEISQKFCAWANSAKSKDDCSMGLRLLAELYFKAHLLVDVEEPFSDSGEVGPAQEISEISRRFADLIPFDPNAEHLSEMHLSTGEISKLKLSILVPMANGIQAAKLSPSVIGSKKDFAPCLMVSL